jgi:hypothetical protein
VAGLAALLLAGCGGAEKPLVVERFVAPAGQDGGDCRAVANPCRSLGYAYRRAADGEHIVLLPGAYGELAIERAPDHAPAVTLTARRGANVAGLTLEADRVTVQGLAAKEVSIDAGDTGKTAVSDIRLIGVRSRTLWIRRAIRLSVRGGAFGDSDDIPPVQIAAAPASEDVRFDGVLFHDARATREDVHTECMWAGGVQGLTIRHSRFRHCAYFDIFLTRMEGPDPRDILVEHTDLGGTVDWQGNPQPFAVNVANWVQRAQDYTFRGNRFGGDITCQPTVLERVTLTGNRGAVRSCRDDIAYARNVWAGGPCGRTDRAGS